MPEPDYALPDPELLKRCQERRCRSSGPGGQHANRTDSAIELVHQSTGLSVRCQDQRSLERNRSRALHCLRLRLAAVQRGQSDPAWLEQRRRGRQVPVTSQASGYHLVIAVCLDALANAEGNLSTAAAACGISSSQLVKVLGEAQEAWQAAQDIRQRHGLSALKRR